jgi:hypothetical protein
MLPKVQAQYLSIINANIIQKFVLFLHKPWLEQWCIYVDLTIVHYNENAIFFCFKIFIIRLFFQACFAELQYIFEENNECQFWAEVLRHSFYSLLITDLSHRVQWSLRTKPLLAITNNRQQIPFFSLSFSGIENVH